MNRKEIGTIGEKLAEGFLKKKGYHIREKNFRCRTGEIDIVAEKKGYLVFVEVRTKTSTNYGTPEESITFIKKDKLIQTALYYIDSHRKLPSSWRFDFVAIELDNNHKVIRIELIENAIY
jgi:putative endonuclease